MPRDPKVNALVKIEAKNNKLEGTVDVLQDRPELTPDLSGSYVVLDNQEGIYTSIIAYPNGAGQITLPDSGSNRGGLNYQVFKKGLNPGVGPFGSPFLPNDPNIIQTFEEASGLEDRFVSGSDNTKRAFLTEEGKYADNALPYKRREFIKEIDIKWSGRKIDGVAPLTTSVGAYSTISPNWQKALSPNSPPQFQTGNLWIQQPIENLWQGDEVIWKLTSGSAFEQGNRVGRNLITGIVGPTTSTLGSIPVIEGVRTTGSSVSVFGSDSSQERFLNGGAIRDNSSSRTYGTHFRPSNQSTTERPTTVDGSDSPPWQEKVYSYNSRFIEHSGKLILSSDRKLIDYKDRSNFESNEQSITINKMRSSDYRAELPPLKNISETNIGLSLNLGVAFIDASDMKITTRAWKNTQFDPSPRPEEDHELFQSDYEGNLRVIYNYNTNDNFTLSNAITSSLSAKYKTFLYDFTIESFNKVSNESTFLPINTKLYLGSPVRFYAGDISASDLIFQFDKNQFIPKTFSRFEELILLTSRGQIFIKRDLGLTDEEFESIEYIDFSDPRLFFASESEVQPNGNSGIQIQNINKESLVEVVGAIGVFPYNAISVHYDSRPNQIYGAVALQYYKIPSNKYFYFNSDGHHAHLMNSDPYSYTIIGNQSNPARDPGFLQGEGDQKSVWAYSFEDNILHAVDKKGVAKFYFTAYNNQFGKPHVISSKLKKITNLVSEFSNKKSLRSPEQYNFPSASSIDLTSQRRVPFLSQGLLKNYNIFPVNTEEEKDLRSIGFIQEGVAPIVKFSEKYQTRSDAFGNGYISDIPSDYLPYFDKDGNVQALFGSNIAVGISKTSGEDSIQVGNINQSLFGLMERTVNYPANFDGNAPLGYAPYNPDNKNGVVYRNILSNAINNVDASFWTMLDFYSISGSISFVPLPRIGLIDTTNEYIPNYMYWKKDPNGVSTNSQFAALAVTGTSLLNSSDEYLRYPKSIVVGSDIDSNTINNFADYDRGVISSSLSNITKNKFNMLNSDLFIQQDQNNRQVFGNFIHTPNEDISLGNGSSNTFTSSLALNFMYDNIPSNTKITHAHGGFSSYSFNIDESNFDSSNRLFIKSNASHMLKIDGPINGMNYSIYTTGNLGQSFLRNELSFACYTISDSEDLYNGQTFSSQSLYLNPYYVPSPKPVPAGTPNVAQKSFLNIPISQSFTSQNSGPSGSALAYINSRNYLILKYGGSYRKVHNYASNQFFIHPKGGLNYALGPTDQYFGTAVVDNSSIRRQITKKISLYVENSCYQTTFGNNEREFANFIASETRVPLYGIPAGNYTWIFNIQDMNLPLPPSVWENSGNPPTLFSSINRNGLDNGLRSNFYWNISQSEINKSIFSGTVSEIKSDREIFVYGKFDGIIGPNTPSSPIINESDLVYGECGITLRIQEVDDIIYDNKKTVTNSGKEQYKGVFIPDPDNKTLGMEGLNIEGNSSEILPSGESAPPFKKIRVDLTIDGTLPIRNFTELCKLGISFRPNSQLPDEIINPTSDDNLTPNTWSPYVGEEYENILRFNTGHAFCFARISSICLYGSRYSIVNSGPSTNETGLPPILSNIPYDPFAHDPDNTEPFIRYSPVVGAVDTDLICFKTPLGYHSLLSFGESCSEFDIGSMTGSNSGGPLYNPSINASAINRSIIDQGNSINIINLAGIAIKTDRGEE